MSPTVPFSIASLSKTITAAAAIKALDQQKQRGLTLDSGIGPYLPVEFRANKHFQEITFRQLLSHTSGIPDLDVDKYGAVLDYIRSQPSLCKKKDNEGRDVREYSNTNYALFRFLIPRLIAWPIKSDDPADSYAKGFMDFVDKNVFRPSSLSQIPTETNKRCGLNYHFPLPNDSSYQGRDIGDLTLAVGSQGWVMSTQQLAKFLRNLHYTDKILPNTLSTLMMDEGLGYDYYHGFPVLRESRYKDTFCAKDGFYPGNGSAGEFWGALVVFSNGASLALFVNSNLDYNWSLTDSGGYRDIHPLAAVVDAFNSAITKK